MFITSSISAGVCSSWSMCRPVWMWCNAAVSKTVRNIFSSLKLSVGRKCLHRTASTSCMYLAKSRSL